MTLFVRIQNFIKYKLVPPHNMFKHKAERFYFEEYYRIIQPYLIKDNKLLDIGCQNGRFTVPAAKAGMTITSTDIKKTYFSFIEKQIPASHIDFRLEGIDESMDLLPKSHYDVVLCLELLYNLPSPLEKIKRLSELAQNNGVLCISHRTIGYYLYRFIKENDFENIEKILNGTHPDYNAQSIEQIRQMYHSAGLKIESITPIGMFSGFGKDAFSQIANPKKQNKKQNTSLLSLETNNELFDMFGNCARYILVVAKKINS